MKKFLMLGTSLENVRIVEYVKKLGIYTIVADDQVKEMSTAKMIADFLTRGCARLRHVASSEWGSKRYLNMEHLKSLLISEQEDDIAL